MANLGKEQQPLETPGSQFVRWLDIVGAYEEYKHIASRDGLAVMSFRQYEAYYKLMHPLVTDDRRPVV